MTGRMWRRAALETWKVMEFARWTQRTFGGTWLDGPPTFVVPPVVPGPYRASAVTGNAQRTLTGSENVFEVPLMPPRGVVAGRLGWDTEGDLPNGVSSPG